MDRGSEVQHVEYQSLFGPKQPSVLIRNNAQSECSLQPCLASQSFIAEILD